MIKELVLFAVSAAEKIKSAKIYKNDVKIGSIPEKEIKSLLNLDLSDIENPILRKLAKKYKMSFNAIKILLKGESC